MNPVRVLPLAVIFVLGSCYPESDLQPESVVTPASASAASRSPSRPSFKTLKRRCGRPAATTRLFTTPTIRPSASSAKSPAPSIAPKTSPSCGREPLLVLVGPAYLESRALVGPQYLGFFEPRSINPATYLPQRQCSGLAFAVAKADPNAHLKEESRCRKIRTSLVDVAGRRSNPG